MPVMKPIIAIICLTVSTFGTQTQSNKSITDRFKRPPSLKKTEKTEAAASPSAVRKRYDSARNVTYVSIDIPLSDQNAEKLASVEDAASTPGMSLTFQLIYKGDATTDLTAAYLILNAISVKKNRSEELSSIKQLEIEAEGYQYSYERIDYKTDARESNTDSPNALSPKKEILVFRLLLDDLPQIANSNKVEVTLGKQKFVIKSMQLLDLRSKLVAS